MCRFLCRCVDAFKCPTTLPLASCVCLSLPLPLPCLRPNPVLVHPERGVRQMRPCFIRVSKRSMWMEAPFDVLTLVGGNSARTSACDPHLAADGGSTGQPTLALHLAPQLSSDRSWHLRQRDEQSSPWNSSAREKRSVW